MLPLTTDTAFLPLTGGADGLAQLTALDFIGEEVDPLDSDEAKARKTRGLRALEEIREVSIIAVPDINIQPIDVPPQAPPPPCIPDPCLPPGPPPPAVPRPPSVGDLPPIFSEADIYRVQSGLIQQCEKLRDRIALAGSAFQGCAQRSARRGRGARMAQPLRFKVCGVLLPVVTRSRSAAIPDFTHPGHSSERACSRTVCAKRFSVWSSQGAGQCATGVDAGCDHIGQR